MLKHYLSECKTYLDMKRNMFAQTATLSFKNPYKFFEQPNITRYCYRI